MSREPKIVSVDWGNYPVMLSRAHLLMESTPPGENRQWHVRISLAQALEEASCMPNFIGVQDYRARGLVPYNEFEVGCYGPMRFFCPDRWVQPEPSRFVVNPGAVEMMP